jgi:hypothetical protein
MNEAIKLTALYYHPQRKRYVPFPLSRTSFCCLHCFYEVRFPESTLSVWAVELPIVLYARDSEENFRTVKYCDYRCLSCLRNGIDIESAWEELLEGIDQTFSS